MFITSTLNLVGTFVEELNLYVFVCSCSALKIKESVGVKALPAQLKLHVINELCPTQFVCVESRVSGII